MSAEFRPRNSLTRRLSIAFVAVALFSVIIVGVALVGLLRLAAAEAQLADLRRQSNAVARTPRLLERDPAQVVRLLRPVLRLSGAALYRFSPAGPPVLVTGSDVVPISDLDIGALAGGETREGRIAGGDVVYVARPIGNPPRGFVVLSSEVAPIPEAFGLIAGRLVLAALVAMSLAALLAFFLARRISRPMKELADAAAGVAKGDFGRRVPAESDDELGVVAESFNRMAADLAETDAKQREFFLSISHELRTPLTAIQGYAEAIEDGTISVTRHEEAAGVIVGETRRLTRLVSDLLDLARIDARRFEVTMEEVDADTVLQAVRHAFARSAEEAGIDMAVETGGESFRADQDRLIQVLSNLVENALRYTPAGRKITLSSNESDGWVQIKVTDGGVGFDAEDLERAFERQYLWQKYRGLRDVGTGLGLAISRELVEAMGGSVEARNAPDGGAEFAIRLRKNK
jgi:two-component system sensor histidine kinase BaeS